MRQQPPRPTAGMDVGGMQLNLARVAGQQGRHEEALDWYGRSIQTLEGLRHRNLPLFSVQYHPEASPGPHDSHYLFKDFVKMMEEWKSSGQ